jgi:OHCU decarboxylase
MTLAELNAVPAAAAHELFLTCCGAHAWAREMTSRRPFPDRASLGREADTIWLGLGLNDWLEAFAAHPRIGEALGTGQAGKAGQAGPAHDAAPDQWATREQAGMDVASEAIRRRMDQGNREYEARFGFIYLVCAAGKRAEDLLAILEERLTHARDEELRIAAEEQRRITHLRLEKLLT